MAVKESTPNIAIDVDIDTADWPPGCEQEKESAAEELCQWFEGLSKKTQLGIYYAQQLGSKLHEDTSIDFDPLNGDCPWHTLVQSAQDRIFLKHTKHFGDNFGYTGCNFFLYTRPMGNDVHSQEED